MTKGRALMGSLEGDSGIEVYLAAQHSEGHLDSHGSFQLPPVDAARKLLLEHRGNPSLYLLKIVQGLVGLGCQSIDIDLYPAAVSIRAKTNLPVLTRELTGRWQALGAYGQPDAIGCLIMGLILAHGTGPSKICVEQRLLSRITRSLEIDSLTESARIGAWGTEECDQLCIRLPVTGGRRVKWEVRDVQGHCRFCPVPIRLQKEPLEPHPWGRADEDAELGAPAGFHLLEWSTEGEALATPTRPPATVVNGAVQRPSQSTLCSLGPQTGATRGGFAWLPIGFRGSCSVGFIHQGVMTERIKFAASIPGMRLLVPLGDLKLDLSQLRVVEDDALKRRLDVLRVTIDGLRAPLLHALDYYVPFRKEAVPHAFWFATHRFVPERDPNVISRVMRVLRSRLSGAR